MFALSYILCLLGFYTNSVSGASDKSFEHQIRAHLLQNYDKTVLPVLGSKSVEVSFAMRVSRLVKVDTREQIVILDTWVIQTWKNEFLSWNRSSFGGFNRVQFLPSEIWVPDISLFNNGDESVTLAGGRAKFVTEVSVDYNGHCVWSGPATFKANCELKVHQWPFDTQTCELGFGSFTYGIDKMNIKIFQDKGGGKFTNRFVTNGDWDIKNITPSIEATDHGDCCPFKFSEIVYNLIMTRKPLYHLFYLTIPSIMLMFLSLSSFLIPVESGERIGFVTTMLLAMTVFLLLIPAFLPETSDGVPILGIGLQSTMVIISLVLFCNIFVLKLFFMEGPPPKWVRSLFCHSNKGKTVQPIHVSTADSQSSKTAVSTNGIELGERPESMHNTPVGWEEKRPQITWQKVSCKLDHVFFALFFLIASITYCVIYLA